MDPEATVPSSSVAPGAGLDGLVDDVDSEEDETTKVFGARETASSANRPAGASRGRAPRQAPPALNPARRPPTMGNPRRVPQDPSSAGARRQLPTCTCSSCRHHTGRRWTALASAPIVRPAGVASRSGTYSGATIDLLHPEAERGRPGAELDEEHREIVEVHAEVAETALGVEIDPVAEAVPRPGAEYLGAPLGVAHGHEDVHAHPSRARAARSGLRAASPSRRSRSAGPAGASGRRRAPRPGDPAPPRGRTVARAPSPGTST